MAGADPNRGAVEALARRLGVADRLHFHGRVPHEKLLGFMAGADTFCMPSRTEGYGLVFLEAMAVGTPVIGCRVGGTRELIRHRANGLLSAPGDAGDLARLLLEVHRDFRLRGRLLREGKRTAELHSIEGMVQETLAVYRDLGLARPRRYREAVFSGR